MIIYFFWITIPTCKKQCGHSKTALQTGNPSLASCCFLSPQIYIVFLSLALCSLSFCIVCIRHMARLSPLCHTAAHCRTERHVPGAWVQSEEEDIFRSLLCHLSGRARQIMQCNLQDRLKKNKTKQKKTTDTDRKMKIPKVKRTKRGDRRDITAVFIRSLALKNLTLLENCNQDKVL